MPEFYNAWSNNKNIKIAETWKSYNNFHTYLIQPVVCLRKEHKMLTRLSTWTTSGHCKWHTQHFHKKRLLRQVHLLWRFCYTQQSDAACGLEMQSGQGKNGHTFRPTICMPSLRPQIDCSKCTLSSLSSTISVCFWCWRREVGSPATCSTIRLVLCCHVTIRAPVPAIADPQIFIGRGQLWTFRTPSVTYSGGHSYLANTEENFHVWYQRLSPRVMAQSDG